MRAVDLFAGCGGLSKGFENAGIDVVAAFEFWDRAAKCYEMNFAHPVFVTDLSDTDKAVAEIMPYSPDMIIGGPPCQDFSHAGKRVESDRAELTKSYAEIIDAVRPQYFVMENVDRARNSQMYHEARDIFKEIGYGLTEMVLDASRCGAPQKRKRFFCIGGLSEKDGFLSDRLTGGLSDHDMTVREFFGDSLGFEYYYRHPRNYSRRAIFSIDEPAPTMRGVNRPVPKGYPGHPNDACRVSDNLRALTTEERALFQTFPADFRWCGTKTDKEQMIGNAVPVKLGEYVARTLKEYVEDREKGIAIVAGTSYDKPEELMLNFAEDGARKPFRAWLTEDKGLSALTAKDMESRVRRANYIALLDTREDGVIYLHRLEKNDDYGALSVSIKSQLKRAVRLYCEYRHDCLYMKDDIAVGQ